MDPYRRTDRVNHGAKNLRKFGALQRRVELLSRISDSNMAAIANRFIGAFDKFVPGTDAAMEAHDAARHDAA
jgi:hypothetical protein